jgi:hypothetical protein
MLILVLFGTAFGACASIIAANYFGCIAGFVVGMSAIYLFFKVLDFLDI